MVKEEIEKLDIIGDSEHYIHEDPPAHDGDIIYAGAVVGIAFSLKTLYEDFPGLHEEVKKEIELSE